MKKKYSRILMLVLTAVMTVSMLAPEDISFAAGREKAGSPSKDDYIRAAKLVRSEDAFNFRTEKDASGLKLKSEKNFPAKYDLRDVDGKCYVTNVKFQNPFGTCWGFAAIAAAESSILGSGIAEDDGYDWTNLNLSEKHLVNFHVRPIADENDSQYGEGMYFDESVTTLQQKFNMGGLPIYASTLFASGVGPNLEDRKLPDSAPAGTPADIYEYHGLKGDDAIDKSWDPNKKEMVDYSYSADDDWSVPEELRFTQSYVLKESYLLPSPAQSVPDDPDDKNTDYHYEYNKAATEAIKDQLLNKRAVEVGFCADQSMPGQESDGKYISRNWAHYTYELQNANHAVTIVGYDDDYPAANFVEGHEPKDENGNLLNGAWLVKNSWGSGEEEFPNRGPGYWGIPNEEGVGTGYFWLSYYDQSLSLPEALSFEESNVGKQYYIDQYDYMPVEDVQSAEFDDLACMSNVFTADQNELLEQVSCLTAAPGTKVKYEIFLLSSGFESPLDGICVASGEQSFEYGGFHKIKLNDPVLIQKGQSFSIIMTQITPEEKYGLNLQLAYGEDFSRAFGQPSWVKGVVNPKESYIMLNGNWYDMGYEESLKEIFGELYVLFTFDNFPIKAYSKPVTDSEFYINVSQDPLKLAAGGPEGSGILSLSLKGGKGKSPANNDIKWEIPEGQEGVFDISVNESYPNRCVVTAIKPGTGYIKVTYPGVGTLAVRVDVSKEGKFTIAADYGLAIGESCTIDEIYDAYGNHITDYTGLFFSSEDPKIATISADGTMTGVEPGKTRIIVSDILGAEASCEIEVYKHDQKLVVSGKKVTVSAAKLKKKAQKIAAKKALKIKGAVGKKTYKKLGGSKKISVNKKTGTITVKKGTKKGTYKVKIRVTAAGNRKYNKASAAATVTIKVK